MPNNSSKPNLLRSGNGVAGKACHAVTCAAQVGLAQVLDRREIMTNPTEQLSPLTLKLFRASKWLFVAGFIVMFASLPFLSSEDISGGLRIGGAFLLLAGYLVNLAGLIRGSKEKSHAV